PPDRSIGPHDAMLDVEPSALSDCRLARRVYRFAIVGMHAFVERCLGSVERFRGHAEDAVCLGGPPRASVAVKIGDPAADMRGLLRLLEERAVLIERFRGAHRLADVAKARDAADDAPVHLMRRDVALENSAVLEVEDV